MIIILTWGVIAYGLTTILVYGSILETPREFLSKKSKFIGELLSCVLCTSTWVGFFLSFSLGSVSHTLFDTNIYISWFFDGMFSAGFVWGLNAIIEFFEENRIKPNNDE